MSQIYLRIAGSVIPRSRWGVQRTAKCPACNLPIAIDGLVERVDELGWCHPYCAGEAQS